MLGIIASSYPSIVVSGLCLWLDAGQIRSYSGSGSTWTDLTANGNNGTLNGTTFDSVAGGSLIFNGSSDYVSFTSLTNLNNSYATHEMWVYFSNPSAATNEQVFARTNTSTGTFNIRKDSVTKAISGSLRDAANTGYGIGNPSEATSVWVHAAITYDGTTWILYLNTSNVASTSISSSINTGGTLSINLGRNTNGQAYFNGQLAIVRAYNRALSSTEISQNFYSENKRFGITP